MQRPKQTLERYQRRQRFINKHQAVSKAASRFFPEYGSVTVSAGILRARANVVADRGKQMAGQIVSRTDLDESE